MNCQSQLGVDEMVLNIPLYDILEMFFQVEILIPDYGCSRIASFQFTVHPSKGMGVST